MTPHLAWSWIVGHPVWVAVAGLIVWSSAAGWSVDWFRRHWWQARARLSERDVQLLGYRRDLETLQTALTAAKDEVGRLKARIGKQALEAASAISVSAEAGLRVWSENCRLRALLRALMAERDEVIDEGRRRIAPWRAQLGAEAFKHSCTRTQLTTAQTTIATLEARLARQERTRGARGRWVSASGTLPDHVEQWR